MDVEMFKILVDNGVTLVIVAVVLVVGISVAKLIPEAIKSRMELDRKRQESREAIEAERNKRYDEQMEILVTVTQQGIEAQKRGNAVIEQNTEAMRRATETEERLNRTVEEFQRELAGLKGR